MGERWTAESLRTEAGPALPLGSPACATILELVRRTRGFDASGYCPEVLASRIQNRFELTGAASLAAYLRRLQDGPGELDALVEALTVKVSSFFRDPLAFEVLAEQVLPELLARKAAARDRNLRIWSAGCATGEEPYSVAILLQELLRRAASPPAVTLLATDLDPRALERARAARYAEAALANVRRGQFAEAFEPIGDGFRVAAPIAGAVTFAVHDLLDHRGGAPAESVFGSFDLVLCRNVLIYFEPAWRELACERIFASLAIGGFLLLGKSESLPGPWARRFRREAVLSSLFRKPSREQERESLR
jgi:chemotaxis methyl-accepting protein methylase